MGSRGVEVFYFMNSTFRVMAVPNVTGLAIGLPLLQLTNGFFPFLTLLVSSIIFSIFYAIIILIYQRKLIPNEFCSFRRQFIPPVRIIIYIFVLEFSHILVSLNKTSEFFSFNLKIFNSEREFLFYDAVIITAVIFVSFLVMRKDSKKLSENQLTQMKSMKIEELFVLKSYAVLIIIQMICFVVSIFTFPIFFENIWVTIFSTVSLELNSGMIWIAIFSYTAWLSCSAREFVYSVRQVLLEKRDRL